MSLPSEYKMFKEHRLAYSDVVYVLARYVAMIPHA